MTDIEKVINDLQDAVNDDWMWQHADYYAKAMENAVALLKEQKPVKPIQFEKKSRITRDKFECGACGSSEIYKNWGFCPYCGKPIDWGGR